MGQVPVSKTTEGLIGNAAPSFTLETALNGTMSLDKARDGKKAVLVFWATWCPHCHDAILRIQRQLADLTAKGIKVLLVDLGETREQVRDYLKYNELSMDSFVDPDAVLQDTYGVVGVPTVYFVDERGIIRAMRFGFPSSYEELFK